MHGESVRALDRKAHELMLEADALYARAAQAPDEMQKRLLRKQADRITQRARDCLSDADMLSRCD